MFLFCLLMVIGASVGFAATDTGPPGNDVAISYTISTEEPVNVVFESHSMAFMPVQITRNQNCLQEEVLVVRKYLYSGMVNNYKSHESVGYSMARLCSFITYFK